MFEEEEEEEGGEEEDFNSNLYAKFFCQAEFNPACWDDSVLKACQNDNNKASENQIFTQTLTTNIILVTAKKTKR